MSQALSLPFWDPQDLAVQAKGAGLHSLLQECILHLKISGVPGHRPKLGDPKQGLQFGRSASSPRSGTACNSSMCLKSLRGLLGSLLKSPNLQNDGPELSDVRGGWR